MPKHLSALIKLTISAGLVLFVVQSTDIAAVWEILRSIPLPIIFTVIIGYVLGQIVSAYKWLLIARPIRPEATLTDALKAYFVGMFVNCFALGIVGGDLVRGLLFAKGTGQRTGALSSVVADRAHGLAVLALFGVVFVALFGGRNFEPELVGLLLCVGLIIVAGWFLGPLVLERITKKGTKLHEKAKEASTAFPKQPKRIFQITLISLLFHALQIMLHWIMGLGVDAEIPLISLFVTIPFVNILSSLPISWNGLGVRENAYIFFLSPLYLTPEQCVAFGALWLFAVITSSMAGGLVLLWNKEISLKGLRGSVEATV